MRRLAQRGLARFGGGNWSLFKSRCRLRKDNRQGQLALPIYFFLTLAVTIKTLQRQVDFEKQHCRKNPLRTGISAEHKKQGRSSLESPCFALVSNLRFPSFSINEPVECFQVLRHACCNLPPVGELPIDVDPFALVKDLILLRREVGKTEIAKSRLARPDK
jgi:hypothetical protein